MWKPLGIAFTDVYDSGTIVLFCLIADKLPWFSVFLFNWELNQDKLAKKDSNTFFFPTGFWRQT